MEAIKELQRQGCKINLIGDKIHIKNLAGAKAGPDKIKACLAEIKARKEEAVFYLQKNYNYDIAIRRVIDKLNDKGITMPKDVELRRESLSLEVAMTEYANHNETSRFIQALDKWERLFLAEGYNPRY